MRKYFKAKFDWQCWEEGELAKSLCLAERLGGRLKLEVCEEGVEGIH